MTISSTALSWVTIKSEISKKRRPFAYAFGQEGVSSHMVVVVGWQKSGGKQFVYIHDPGPVNVGTNFFILSWDEYLLREGVSPHLRDYYKIQKN